MLKLPTQQKLYTFSVLNMARGEIFELWRLESNQVNSTQVFSPIKSFKKISPHVAHNVHCTLSVLYSLTFRHTVFLHYDSVLMWFILSAATQLFMGVIVDVANVAVTRYSYRVSCSEIDCDPDGWQYRIHCLILYNPLNKRTWYSISLQNVDTLKIDYTKRLQAYSCPFGGFTEGT